MTHQEVKALAGHRAIPPWIMKLVSDAIAIEVAREREACAEVCDVTIVGDEYATALVNSYADKIRARGGAA